MPHAQRFHLIEDNDAARAAAEQLFAIVRGTLEPVLPAATEILHIGATAIPGCLTKGDLDIAARVERADFTAAESCLAARFTRNDGSVRTDDFAAFEDASRTPHLGIQLTVKGGPIDVFHRFAMALRADPELVARYNALKRAHHDHPMTPYRAGKDAFISDVLRSCPSPPHSRHEDG
ncbi:GrpB family protein [Methylobacterium sp. J-048]|uniref:GrpB family protein n=1 Tax=Methylobacterium sp. J-048 TaxID=2836635 RepID=UPI001FB8C85E|nr:GrpB family protein [Methylobacterium sp. J-048]MCJ2058577.1 GrpB family protein [Methylobacterium sp. J-048]